MSQDKSIAAVIFDMDGLMLDTEQLALKFWSIAAAEFGREISQTTLLACIGRDVKASEIIIKQELGQDFDFYQARQLRIEYTEAHIRKHGVPIKAGLFDLFAVLEAHAVPKAVATSTAKARAEMLLTAAQIIDRFTAVTGGDEVPRSKPEPDIYLLTAKRLDIPPANCLVLEDSDSGIRAAAQAGMQPLLVPDIKPPSEEALASAHKVFADLGEVTVYLDGVLG